MPAGEHRDFHDALHRFEERLPQWIARSSRWLRKPGSAFVRYPVAILLVIGGFLGFLPILGFWMVPLGLLLIAVDLPVLRPPLIRCLHWIERKWPHRGAGENSEALKNSDSADPKKNGTGGNN